MTKQNSLFGIVFASALVFAAILLGTSYVYANPSQFVGTTQTATASTSLVFMTPGTATSSLIADTYNSSTGNNYTNNLTELLVQFTASSTLSKLNINFEYSTGYANGLAADCVNAPSSCDWYQDTVTNVTNFATTSQPAIGLSQVPQYQWAFSSSTIGQIAPTSTSNRDARALRVVVPVRYVRALFSCASGGLNCAVWAQFVSSKEVR